ncbi:hypothetical protein C4D60_Mb04t34180 [Musa balbisiana]|uniref:Uncharacterized protein n=1 Tax=Musa balbisiana TaxID=52838 RepID=A0A4V4HA88_MUSBA|nr:hypothetical protein C4D60_Mb04t34180 [Musa balbisiana]
MARRKREMKKKAKGIYGGSSSDSGIGWKRELAPGQDVTASAEVNLRFVRVSISDLDTCVEAAVLQTYREDRRCQE